MAKSITFCGILFLLMAVSGCAHSQQGFEYCCFLGTEQEAAAQAAAMEEKVEGLEVEVEAVEIADEPGASDKGYVIRVHHESMTQEEICRALGEEMCPPPEAACPDRSGE